MNTVEKIRNHTDAELKQQEHDLMDQLFRLKFQMKMGQTESLNKIRGLRRDVARVKTIVRERSLGIATKTAKPAQAEAKVAAPKAAAKTTTKTAKAAGKTAGKTKSAAKKK
ncbi:MAG TPA: 50S ribosomal protein L29 [Terriglobales bacterium]|nr:50S ribosomal protein L29 [Terriglobales bacterium]